MLMNIKHTGGKIMTTMMKEAIVKTNTSKGMSLDEMKKKVNHFEHLKNDIVVPYKDIYVNPDLTFDLGRGYQLKEVSERFLLSAAEKLHFGTKDTVEMFSDPAERGLLASVLNHRLYKLRAVSENKDRNCMIRTFKENPFLDTEYGEKDRYGRVFLSDRYARIDNATLMDTILDIIPDDMDIISSYVNPDTMMIKVATPEIKGIEVFPGDCYRFGIMFRNNEIGEGSVAMFPFLYRVVCTNGMVVEEHLERYVRPHLGTGLTPTYNLPITGINGQQISMIKDGMAATAHKLFSSDGSFRKVVEHIQNTVNFTATLDAESLLYNLGKEYSLSREEKKVIQDHYLGEGDRTLHGLMQAVTRSAQDVDTYIRRTELETIGGNLAFLSARKWEYLNRPVEKKKRGKAATPEQIALAIEEAERIVAI